MENTLNETDNYQYERRNSGKNYSELVCLNSVDDTDKATKTINSCIRNLFNSNGLSCFVTNLCDVVGDLHDNVKRYNKPDDNEDITSLKKLLEI